MRIKFYPFIIILLFVSTAQLESQTLRTPPTPTGDRAWSNWWYDNSVEDVEIEFNAARRNEESQRNLATGTLGNLNLPADFLSRDFKEQALILINLERQARHNVSYPGLFVATGLELEGVEYTLSGVAQGHADDMQLNDFFSHTSSNGQSAGSRITSAFPGCYQTWSENISWNSISSPSGFILTIPLAVYSFMYDDGACCGWGHRNLCLKQTNGNNDYGDPNKLGIVGFGRAPGTNGDYFVMDYLDPKGSCNYNLIDFGGTCPDYLTLDGSIYSGTYQAMVSLESTGTIMQGEDVTYNAGNEIVLNSNFELMAGSTLDISIDNCTSSIIGITAYPEKKKEIPIITFVTKHGMPVSKIMSTENEK